MKSFAIFRHLFSRINRSPLFSLNRISMLIRCQRARTATNDWQLLFTCIDLFHSLAKLGLPRRSLPLPRIYFMQLSMGLFLKYRVLHRVLLLISRRVCAAWPRLSLESDIHFIKRACARHRDVRKKKKRRKRRTEK